MLVYCIHTDQVSKVLADVDMAEEHDDWLSMTSTSSATNSDSTTSPPHIRLKLKYKHDVILPVKDYMDLQKVKL